MASLSPYIASIDMWAPNFAPRGYAFCAGQILAISSNTALFSLIGTFYGGNGTSTFSSCIHTRKSRRFRNCR